MDGLFLHPSSSGPVGCDLFFSSFFLTPSWALFFAFLAPSWVPSWPQNEVKNTKSRSQKAIFFRMFVFIMKFDVFLMIFDDFLRSREPSRIGRADEICTFAKISFFTLEDHFGLIFDLISELLATPDRSKSALGGSFESFRFFINFRTPFVSLFSDFWLPKGVPGEPQNSSPDLLLSHFGPPGALAGSRCLSGGVFFDFLLNFNDFSCFSPNQPGCWGSYPFP